MIVLLILSVPYISVMESLKREIMGAFSISRHECLKAIDEYVERQRITLKKHDDLSRYYD